jgi:hypothetical protein
MNLRWLIAAACVGALYQACTIANDLRVPGPKPPGRVACVLRGFPALDAGVLPNSPSLPEMVFALRDISFKADGGAPAGFDLDEQCACGRACKRSSEDPDCGRPDGVDNQGLALDGISALTGVTLGARLSQERISVGRGGLVVAIRDYSGEPNDSEVRVLMFPSDGISDGDAGNAIPKFNASDRWVVGANASRSDAGVLSARDQGVGYVKDGVLNVRFSSVDLRFSADLSFALQEAVLQGSFDLRTTGAPMLTSAMFAGRWKKNDAVANVLRFSTDGGVLCRNVGIAFLVGGQVCGAADVPAQIGTSPEAPCDAISFGVSMQFARATFGAFIVPTPKPDPCEGLPTTCP